ncbi:MAG: hypothetical protein QW632_01640 [Ignisphaera sp.]
MDDYEIEIPQYFFEISPIKLLWLDLIEKWVYLELEIECPVCFKKNSYTVMAMVNEIDLIKHWKCNYCGYSIGDLLYRYVNEEISYLDRYLASNAEK